MANDEQVNDAKVGSFTALTELLKVLTKLAGVGLRMAEREEREQNESPRGKGK